MPERYRPDKKTIGELLTFSSPIIEVSSIQRDYSWQLPQIKAFWEDITTFSEQFPGENIADQEYFLGSIVLANKGDGRFLLINGQQRLATATILLSVVRNYLSRYNQNAANQTQSEYIAKIDYTRGSPPNYARVYKLHLYHSDISFFRQEIQDSDPSVPSGSPTAEPKLRSHQLIRSARQFFSDRFEEKYTTLSQPKAAFHWALRIQRVLTGQVSVVVAIATDEQTAYDVFETLNDRGIGVAGEDLIRNFLILKASSPARAEVENALDNVWSLEPDIQVEEYFRHYWLSHRGDIKSRSLYREIRDSVTQDNTDTLVLTRDILRLSDIYRDILGAKYDDPDIQESLEGIRALGANSLLPAALSAFDIAQGNEHNLQLSSFLKSLVTLHVRHNVIGNLESTRLEEEVFDIARQLRAEERFDNCIKRIVAFAPSDEEFKEAFSTAEIRRPSIARYILQQLELAKRQTGELDIAPAARVNLEHVYPRSPIPTDRDPALEQLVYRIGNLTILSKRLNQAVRNRVFKFKKPHYAQSALLLTRELTDETKYPEWIPQVVINRQLELAAVAVQIWSFHRT